MSVYCAERRASVNLVYHSQHGRLHRREQSTVRIGKSEAEVINNALEILYCLS